MTDIDSALKAVALSDLFLENFESKPQNQMTIFYEDMIKAKSGYLHAVSKYVGIPIDESDLLDPSSKLTPTDRIAKASKTAQFRTWFLDNYHDLGGNEAS